MQYVVGFSDVAVSLSHETSMRILRFGPFAISLMYGDITDQLHPNNFAMKGRRRRESNPNPKEPVLRNFRALDPEDPNDKAFVLVRVGG